MNTDMLKGKLREKAMTQSKASESIGISLSAFNAKLNGKQNSEFTLGEALALKRLLDLDAVQTDQIFFS